MILERGNMWDVFEETDHFLFTGNKTIKKNGALVMGRGIAREVRDRFPGIDLAFGREIKRLKDEMDIDNYFVIDDVHPKIAAFQVKDNFRDHADLNLIRWSTRYLIEWARDIPKVRFDLNFPGVGNGKRSVNEVYPIIESLPDNVHVWQL